MSKSNATEADVLAKIFRNTAFPWDAITDLYIALHTADPGEAGTQLTNEATYTGYARIPVARDATGWDLVGSQISNDDLLQFPQCTGGTNVVTHVSIGTAASGAGQILYKGALNASLSVSNLIQPQFAANALVVEED